MSLPKVSADPPKSKHLNCCSGLYVLSVCNTVFATEGNKGEPDLIWARRALGKTWPNAANFLVQLNSESSSAKIGGSFLKLCPLLKSSQTLLMFYVFKAFRGEGRV